MQLRVMVAGAGGLLGRLIVRQLLVRGHAVRAMVRRASITPAYFADPAGQTRNANIEIRRVNGLRRGAWEGHCEQVDAVVSCLGASVNPSPLVGWRSYSAVDAPANLALLSEATRAGVRKFVYVSLIGGDTSRQLDYAEGHERVVDGLRQAKLAATVLRPTGFFAAMGELLQLARRGSVPVFGDGSCRTNPIDESDVAAAVVDAVQNHADGFREILLGGPDEFSRRQVAELAFAALGKKPRLMHLSPALMSGMGRIMCLANPRAGHFLRFAVHVMTHPCLAPRVGTHRLETYFRILAEPQAPPL